jgi:hypothetical protein
MRRDGADIEIKPAVAAGRIEAGTDPQTLSSQEVNP